MSDIARLWSRSLRGGLNNAEHLTCRELGEYHNHESGLCCPSLETICEIYEFSPRYLGKVLCRLENWRLLRRDETHFINRKGNIEQTSNRYILNLEQHFPDPLPVRHTNNKNKKAPLAPYDRRDHDALFGAAQGAKLLRLVKGYIKDDDTLRDGIKEGFLQRRPGKSPLFWLAIESESAWSGISKRIDEGSLITKLKRDHREPGHVEPRPFDIKLTPLFHPRKRKPSVFITPSAGA